MVHFGMPFGFEVDFTCWLTFVLDREPLVNAVAIYYETAQFSGTETNALIFANIVIPNVVVQFITQVVNLNVEVLVLPLGSFPCIIGN